MSTSASPKKTLRKVTKPLVEKKRRERINKSLEQLKSLVLDALKKDPSKFSKLEKADILEMTVKHLKSVQRHHLSSAVSADPSVAQRYQSGFVECAQEVTRYMSTVDGMTPEVRMRLAHHLGNRMHQIVPSQQQQQQQQQHHHQQQQQQQLHTAPSPALRGTSPVMGTASMTSVPVTSTLTLMAHQTGIVYGVPTTAATMPCSVPLYVAIPTPARPQPRRQNSPFQAIEAPSMPCGSKTECASPKSADHHFSDQRKPEGASSPVWRPW